MPRDRTRRILRSRATRSRRCVALLAVVLVRRARADRRARRTRRATNDLDDATTSTSTTTHDRRRRRRPRRRPRRRADRHRRRRRGSDDADASPPFAGTVSTVTAADVPSSYHAGCPVGPAQLRDAAHVVLGLRRPTAHRHDDRERGRGRRRARGVRQLVRASASRSGGWSRSTRSAGAIPRRWPPTTRRRSTAATRSRPVRRTGRRTRTAKRST